MSANPRIVVLGDWERAFPRLADWTPIRSRAELVFHHEPLAGAALLEAIGEADALVLTRDRTPVDAALLAQCPRLRLLVFTGTRNNTLDLAAVHRAGIAVCHTAWGPSKDSTCEMTWALILAAVRQIVPFRELLQGGAWRPPQSQPLPGVLHGETLGLVGLGEIGSRVARVGQALGMNVITWSPHMTAERAAQHGATAVSLEDLLARSRVVSLHLVPGAATRHLIDERALARMRPDSLLVNTSRASLVDTDALVQALRQGRPGAAALDVFDTEPLPADHPLRSLPNVLLTPHLGFVTEPVYTRFAEGVSECLGAWLDGAPLPRQLAPEPA